MDMNGRQQSTIELMVADALIVGVKKLDLTIVLLF